MIGYLEGKLRHKSPDYIIIDVNGVGYCVHVPLSTFYELPDLNQAAVLNIYTHVREDTLQLYGFRSQAEKEMFLFLITVNGVGPRLAMNILSGIDPDGLRELVLRQDLGRLRSIPGVGKKIAERIVLELRDKLKVKKDETDGADGAGPVPAASQSDTYSDAFSAMLNLGYRPAEAEKALTKAQSHLGGSPPLEALLKNALRLLA